MTFVTFSSSSALGCIDGDWLPPKQKSDLTVAHRDSGDALLRVKVHVGRYIHTHTHTHPYVHTGAYVHFYATRYVAEKDRQPRRHKANGS